MKATALLEPMRVLASEHGGTRGSAGRRGAETKIEKHALSRDSIERRRSRYLVPVHAGMRPTPVVRQAKQDIRTRIGCAAGKYPERENQEGNRAESEHGGQ